MSDPRPVAVIGRYALYDEIAAGGMATVHMGRLLGPVGFARTVAVKRLHPQYAKDPEFVSMFLDEARLAARIRHPNVVPTLDVVALTGELFLVMEYVHGVPLSRLMRAVLDKTTRIPAEIVGSIIVQALHGLHAAHEAKSERGLELGIVHRDVSPQNIMVGSDGLSRVLDFGVAKATWRIQTTRDGQVKGKLSYMAPEQVTGGKVGPWTDVYAVAIVFWEALTGERLFNKSDNEGVLARFAKPEPVAPPSSINRQLPPAIDAVVLRGLAPDPKRRYATAQEMADEIEANMRIASTSTVARWVQSLAHDELQNNAKRITEIESCSSVSSRPGSESPSVRGLLAAARAREDSDPNLDEATVSEPRPSDYSQRSQISMTRSPTTTEQQSPSGRRMIWVSSAVALAALLLLVTSLTRLRNSEPLPEHLASAAQLTKEAPAAQTTAPTVKPATVAVAEAQPVAVAPQVEQSDTRIVDADDLPKVIEPEDLPKKGRTARTRTQARTTAPSALSPSAAASAAKVGTNCNPPYVVDSRGIRHMKISCLK